MFNIGGSELALLLILAVVLIGPKQLPSIFAQLGKMYRDFQKASLEVQEDLKVTLREENLKKAQQESGQAKEDSSPTPEQTEESLQPSEPEPAEPELEQKTKEDTRAVSQEPQFDDDPAGDDPFEEHEPKEEEPISRQEELKLGSNIDSPDLDAIDSDLLPHQSKPM